MSYHNAQLLQEVGTDLNGQENCKKVFFEILLNYIGQMLVTNGVMGIQARIVRVEQ